MRRTGRRSGAKEWSRIMLRCVLFAAERPELIKHVEVFHSQIPHSKQEEISASLLTSDGTVKIVIATSALSMGFDAKGGLEQHNNLENYACCDFCDPSVNDTFLKSLVKEKQTTLANFKDLQTYRTVRDREREDFRAALQYQQHFYTSNLPFVDPELTDGIIKVLSDHVNKLKTADDVLHLAPGLSLHIVEDIVEIIEELFSEK
ncbi:hypothetical protein ACHWQZ_G007892 [Mnemiopsis leidyi]